MKRQSTAGRPEYSNTAEAPEKDLKNSFMKIIEVLKEEMKKVLKEIKEKTNWKESTNLLKNAKKAKKVKQVKEIIQDMKTETEAIMKA